jgi:hypothetical protein
MQNFLRSTVHGSISLESGDTLASATTPIGRIGSNRDEFCWEFSAQFICIGYSSIAWIFPCFTSYSCLVSCEYQIEYLSEYSSIRRIGNACESDK